jgi:hypothetical protein
MLAKKNYFIIDRGYESYNNLAHVCEKDAFFLVRAKDINSSGIISGLKRMLSAKDVFDIEIERILTRNVRMKWLVTLRYINVLHKKDCLDYIDLKDNLYYKMKLRVLRFPISETEYECIITNLPTEDFFIRRNQEVICYEMGN